MSGGGGGGGQMPMASNRGQRQQQQMGQMPPSGGMFGAPMMQTAQPQGMMGSQIAQQVPGGFQMDQSALQQMMQQIQQMQGAGGGMQPAMGIAALGGQSPAVDKYGIPYDAPPQMPMQGGVSPYQENPNQVDMRPTNMQQPTSMPNPAGAGMPPGYRPTKGPIDGRKLRDMMDITRRRPIAGLDDSDMGRLPGAIANDLPPSLKRPTQGSYKNFK